MAGGEVVAVTRLLPPRGAASPSPTARSRLLPGSISARAWRRHSLSDSECQGQGLGKCPGKEPGSLHFRVPGGSHSRARWEKPARSDREA